MKYLDPKIAEIARSIVSVLPKATTKEEKAENVTALSVLLFATARTMNIEPGLTAIGMLELSETADAAIAELNEAGVVL